MPFLMSFYPGQNTTISTTLTFACQSTAVLSGSDTGSSSGSSNNALVPTTAYGGYRSNPFAQTTPPALAHCTLVSPLSNMGRGLVNNRNLTLQVSYLGTNAGGPTVFAYAFASSVMMASSSFRLPSSFLTPSYLTNPLKYEQIMINLQFSLNGNTLLDDVVALTYNDRSFAIRFVESLSGVDVTGRLKYPSGLNANKVNNYGVSWSDAGQQPLLFGALRHWDWVGQHTFFPW